MRRVQTHLPSQTAISPKRKSSRGVNKNEDDDNNNNNNNNNDEISSLKLQSQKRAKSPVKYIATTPRLFSDLLQSQGRSESNNHASASSGTSKTIQGPPKTEFSRYKDPVDGGDFNISSMNHVRASSKSYKSGRRKRLQEAQYSQEKKDHGDEEDELFSTDTQDHKDFKNEVANIQEIISMNALLANPVLSSQSSVTTELISFLSSEPESALFGKLDRVEVEKQNQRQEEDEKFLASLDDKLTSCPMCGNVLSNPVRERFENLKDTLRRSLAICRAHTKEDVLITAQKQNYPTRLNEKDILQRSEKFTAVLLQICREEIPSVMRDQAYRMAMKSKANRVDALAQLQDSDVDVTPGYYGLKGQEIMTRFCLSQCDMTLKRECMRHKWISKISVTGYISAVLVPELATRLIMEDRRVSHNEAEAIRIESSSYGRLKFNEDEDGSLEELDSGNEDESCIVEATQEDILASSDSEPEPARNNYRLARLKSHTHRNGKDKLKDKSNKEKKKKKALDSDLPFNHTTGNTASVATLSGPTLQLSDDSDFEEIMTPRPIKKATRISSNASTSSLTPSQELEKIDDFMAGFGRLRDQLS
ncbi:RTC4-like domain-containing protein [Lipomyces japonicus]|uniref:RTC4-like domain-containing protein n=1 Tax=Lipomyces japonicus TaxID=56871 RepID=UPI0034CF8C22